MGVITLWPYILWKEDMAALGFMVCTDGYLLFSYECIPQTLNVSQWLPSTPTVEKAVVSEVCVCVSQGVCVGGSLSMGE